MIKGLLMSALLTFAMMTLTAGQAVPNDGETSGAGQSASPASATVSPGNIDFGDQVTRMTSRGQRITVTNDGGKELYVNSVKISGDEWQDFSVVGDSCTGKSIAPQKSCVIDVAFTPAATGTRRSLLQVTDGGIDSPQSVKLAGNGINSINVPPSP